MSTVRFNAAYKTKVRKLLGPQYRSESDVLRAAVDLLYEQEFPATAFTL